MNDRTCIVTRETKQITDLIRFVATPSHEIIADIKHKLPGRGVYVTAKKSLVEQAVNKNILVNYFKRLSKDKNIEYHINKDIADTIEKQLTKQVVKALSLGRKAGAVVNGATSVDKAIRANNVAMVLHTKSAAQDGITKISQAIHALKLHGGDEVTQQSLFNEDELEDAFGLTKVIHLAILKTNITKNILSNLEKLHIYTE